MNTKNWILTTVLVLLGVAVGYATRVTLAVRTDVVEVEEIKRSIQTLNFIQYEIRPSEKVVYGITEELESRVVIFTGNDYDTWNAIHGPGTWGLKTHLDANGLTISR